VFVRVEPWRSAAVSTKVYLSNGAFISGWVAPLSNDPARHAVVPSRRRRTKSPALRVVGAVAIGCALAAASSASAQPYDLRRHHSYARTKLKPAPKPPEAVHASKQPFGTIPKGPVQIIISIDQQTLHLYSDGAHVTDTLIATGVPAHPTPMGVFSVIQKSLLHHSNIYSGAPMPYMQRITWSGVAMHEGGNLGHPASHGCIRMSHDFATRLWVLTRLGARVVIARPELRPEDFADPHLFVHKEPTVAPDPSASAQPTIKALRTALTADDDSKATDTPGQLKDEVKAAASMPADRKAADPLRVAADTDKTAERPIAPAVGEVTKVATSGESESAAAASPSATAAPPVPMPAPKPTEIAHASKTPISVFVSGKEKKIYVRQDFSPLFSAPITIEHPEQRLGTHVFTAMEYLGDHSSFRWNVISPSGEQAGAPRSAEADKKGAPAARADARAAKPPDDLSPPQSPQQALARIGIPQDTIDRISLLFVPGSSLIVSDQRLGEETGEGTDFIVVTPSGEARVAAGVDRRPRRSARYQRGPAYWSESYWR
jgi:lipoprotein-anchoring transpeptidase ErfK/SrfK